MDSRIKGLAKSLVEEVIRADMSMHASQIEAWTWIAKHRPRGEKIPRNIMEGLAKSRYLAMNEVNFELKLRPRPVKNYWQRALFGIRLISGFSKFDPNQEYIHEYANNQDQRAQAFQIKIKRFENGNIQASYDPTDDATKDIMGS
jgi:hypothetical protein